MIDKEFIYGVLPQVSRTFAISIRLLKEPLRLQVAHAYLICRLLDTFEDDPSLPLPAKKKALQAIQEALKKRRNPSIKSLAKKLKAPQGEKELVLHAEDLIDFLNQFSFAASDSIVRWAVEMGHGMIDFAFSPGRSKNLVKTMDDLDRYCYYVAGTVGNLLTELFIQQIKHLSARRKKILLQNKEGFGKALQMVNIIKDSSKDITEGRCFIPSTLFTEFNITQKKFFSGKALETNQLIYDVLIKSAEEYLSQALTYTKAIPRKERRIRLFCILPMVMAKKTLNLIKENIKQLINEPGSVKINRAQVKKIYISSQFAAFSNTWLQHLMK